MQDLSFLEPNDDQPQNAVPGNDVGPDLSFLETSDPVTDQAREHVSVSSGISPEEEARMVRLSRESGMPLPMVRTDPNRAEEYAKTKDLRDLLQVNPGLAKYLGKSPSHAAVSKDDGAALSNAENLWGYIKGLGTEAKQSYERGSETQVEMPDLAYAKYNGGLSDEQKARYDELKNAHAAPVPERDDLLGYLAQAAGEQAPMQLQLLGEAAKGATGGLAVGTAAGLLAGPASPVAAPALGITAATAGATAYTAARAYKMEFGAMAMELEDMRDENGEPLPPDVIYATSAAVGAINSGLEIVGEAAMAKLIPGVEKLTKPAIRSAVKTALANRTTRAALTRVGQKWAGAVGTEAVTEMAQEVVNILGDAGAGVASNELSGTYFDQPVITSENAARVFEAGKKAAAASLVFTAPGAGYHAAAGIAEARRTQQYADGQIALNEAVNASQTQARSPERMEEFLDVIGAGEEVYVPGDVAQEFYQSGRGDMLKRLGVTEEMAKQAAAMGQEVTVKTSAMHARLDPTEFKSVVETVRPAPGALSARDLAKISPEEELGKALDVYDAVTRGEREFTAEANRLRAEIVQTGATPEYADSVTRVISAASQRLGREAGRDNATLLRKIQIGVEKAIGGNAYEQAAYHGSPHRFDKFTLDRIGTGEGAQAFGWGLYFAGNKEVAEWYRANLAKGVSLLVPTEAFKTSLVSRIDETYQELVNSEAFTNGPYDATLNRKVNELYQARRVVASLDVSSLGQYFGSAPRKGWIPALLDWGKAVGVKVDDLVADDKGQLYEVDIPEDDSLLLWDKPLSEQPEKVRAALEGDLAARGLTIRAHQGLQLNPEEPAPVLHELVDADGKVISTQSEPFSGGDLYSVLSRSLAGDRAASERLNSLGIKGIKYLDGTSRSAGEGAHNYVIFDDTAIDVRNTFYQGEAARGAVTVADDRYLVSLYKDADLSTLVHETGHIFLEELRSIIRSGEASTELKRDFASVQRWLGVTLEEGLTREQHEKFARGFEAYLREGKAPTQELVGAFERFKSWLMRIYQDAKNLNVTLTDEVRGVFDRLLATREQIDEAALANEITVRTRKEMDALGLTKPDQDYLDRLMSAAKKRAEAAMIQDMNRNRRTLQAAWRKLATKEIERDPVYQAREDLHKFGGLDSDMIAEEWGQDTVDQLRKKNVRYAKRKGRHPEAVASQHGFASATEMIEAIIASRPKGEKIKEILAQKEANHDAEFKAEDYLIDSDELAEHMEHVGRYIGKMVGREQEVTRRAFTRLAERELLAKPVRDAARIDRHLAAMRKALQDERRALGKGDFNAALVANRKARLNHEFARMARKIENEKLDLQDRARAVLRAQKGKIDLQHLENLKALMGRYRLGRKDVAPENISGKTPLATLLAAPEDPLLDVGAAFPDWLIGEQDFRDFRSLTVNEMRDLANLMKHLEHRGRDLVSQKIAHAKMALDDLANSLAAPMDKLKGKKVWSENSRIGDLVEKNREWFAEQDILLYLMRRADAYQNVGKTGRAGINERMIINPLGDAYSESLQLGKEITAQIKPALAQLAKSAVKAKKRIDVGVPVPAVMRLNRQDAWTFERITAIALNLGNTYNREAVKAGYGLTDSDIAKLTGVLSEQDWQAIQQIWDGVNSLWPRLDDVFYRLNGFRQKKVDAEPLTTPYGTLAGGYYPIRFDPSLDGTTAERNEIQVFKDTANAAVAPSASFGAMKGRTHTGGKPVMLSLGVLAQHLEYAKLYITHAEIVRDVNRIFTHKDYRSTFESKLGKAAYAQLRPILKGIARSGNKKLSTMDGAINKLRGVMSVYYLGSSINSPLTQPLGTFNYVADEGFGTYFRGLGKTLTSPLKSWELMHELSPYMEDRAKSLNREVQEIRQALDMKKFRLKGMSLSDFNELFLLGIQWSDALVTTPMWWGSYEKALKANNGDIASAVRTADEIIASAQSSFRPMDRSALLRDGAGSVSSLFTMFFSFANALQNRQRTALAGALEGKVSIPRLMKTILLEGVLPPILYRVGMSALYGKTPDAEDLVWDVLLYQLTGMPFLRDLAGYVARTVQGQMSMGMLSSPALQPFVMGEKAITTLWRAANDMDDDEKREKAIWAMAELLSVTLLKGTPVARIAKRMQQGWDQYENGDGTWFNIINPDPDARRN